jgi:hypothetical protein
MLTIDLNFATLIPALARTHQLIGVEMQGHGRTSSLREPSRRSRDGMEPSRIAPVRRMSLTPSRSSRSAR